MADSASGTKSRSDVGGGLPAEAAAASRSDTPTNRRAPLPDWLRSQTVTAFAPYTCWVFTAAGAERIPILWPNPMRVGIVLAATGGFVGRVTATVAGAPAGHVVLSLTDGDTRSGMLADLMSLITAGWYVDTPGACSVSVVEFTRPM